MDASQKTRLIREGNAAMNAGNIDRAAQIFKATNYQDGLIRVGDYYYFEKQQPLMAFGYYKQANHNQMIEKIFEGFNFALRCWLDEDKKKSEKPTSENIEVIVTEAKTKKESPIKPKKTKKQRFILYPRF